MKILQPLLSILVIVGIVIGLLYMLEHLFKKIPLDKNKLWGRFTKSILDAVILIAGVYACLSLFSVTREFAGTLLKSGTLFIAVATFAAQKTLGNVVSGFSISASRPFEVGQLIRIKSEGGTLIAEGTVQDMTVRHVVLRSPDGKTIIVPNSVLDNAVIVNEDAAEHASAFLAVEISYDSDVDQAKAVLKRLCAAEPAFIGGDIVDPLVSRFTENGIELKFTVVTATFAENYRLCCHLREEILQVFKAEGIKIPYKTITITEAT